MRGKKTYDYIILIKNRDKIVTLICRFPHHLPHFSQFFPTLFCAISKLLFHKLKNKVCFLTESVTTAHGALYLTELIKKRAEHKTSKHDTK